MAVGRAGPFGDFALFGFSRDPDGSLEDKFTHLGITPRVLDFGPSGRFYLYTTYGDVAETEQHIGLKLGFVRTPGMSPLSTAELLAHKLISPQDVDQDGIRGSAVVACFSKTDPEFCIYQTLLATPQLYYTSLDGDILCASNQRCLVALLDRLELNEDILPFHFLFQVVPGPLTSFRNVQRLFPGQRLHWRGGTLTVEIVKDLRFSERELQFSRVDADQLDLVYDRIREVINSYVNDASNASQDAATLLSGGVDSSIIQVAMNERQPPGARPRTYGYTLHVLGLGFEAQYAREASQLLGTDHAIADVFPEDFPGYVCQAIEEVAQPIPSEANACKMALAQFLASRKDTPRFYLVGQGADAVYGMGVSRKLMLFDILRQIPASEPALRLAAAASHPASNRIAHGLREIATALSVLNDPRAFEHWSNSTGIYTNFEIARRSFGDQALQDAFEYRRNLEKQYLHSPNLSEQVHVIDLLTYGYEPAVTGSQLFLSRGKEQIYPYLDEDVIRIAFAFAPRVRFVNPRIDFLDHRHTKHILKRILARKSYASIALKRKGASVFDNDLFAMMKGGPLRGLVEEIERPGFLSQADYDTLLQRPDYFLWNLLTFDIFRRRVLAGHTSATQTQELIPPPV